MRDDRQRQDRRLPAPDPAQADWQAARHACAGATPTRNWRQIRRPQSHRRPYAADGCPISAASAWGPQEHAFRSGVTYRRHAGPAARSFPRALREVDYSVPCSTRRTGCSIWAFCPISARVIAEAGRRVRQRDDPAPIARCRRKYAQPGDDQHRTPVDGHRPPGGSPGAVHSSAPLLVAMLRGEYAMRWCSPGRSISRSPARASPSSTYR